MKVCIGELFLEVHAGLPYMLAQAVSALLRSVNQARLGILARRRRVWVLSSMGPMSIKLLANEGLDSRIPEAPLCCALRAKRGLAFWQGGAGSGG